MTKCDGCSSSIVGCCLFCSFVELNNDICIKLLCCTHKLIGINNYEKKLITINTSFNGNTLLDVLTKLCHYYKEKDVDGTVVIQTNNYKIEEDEDDGIVVIKTNNCKVQVLNDYRGFGANVSIWFKSISSEDEFCASFCIINQSFKKFLESKSLDELYSFIISLSFARY